MVPFSIDTENKSREGENAAVIANKVQIYLTTWNTIYLTDI